MTSSRVLLCEPDDITRRGLRLVLERGGLDVAAEAGDRAGALDAARAHPCGVAVIAAELPGGCIDATRELLELDPRLRVIVMSAAPAGDELLAAVIAGATGYLPKQMSLDRLPHAVRGVLDGEVALPRRHTDHVLAELRRRDVRRQRLAERTGAKVSDREWEVLQMLDDGASTAEIAQQLRISQVTVRRHVSTLLAKLGVHDRAAALDVIRRSAD